MPAPARTTRRAAFLIVMIVALVPTHLALAAPLVDQPFEDPAWHEEWVDWRAADEANTAIVEAYRSNGLSVVVPSAQRRGTGPHYRFADPQPTELWFRYHLRLDDWQAVTSGKLPGPAGVYHGTGQGCRPSTASKPGWSARMMFAAGGSNGAPPGSVPIGYYTYHLDQPGDCGEWMLWDPGVLDQRRWYCIEGHIALNTPGSRDGVLEGWLDGAQAFRRTDLAFRRETESNIGVRSFWLNVYLGGSTVTNPTDLGLRIDELEVSAEGRVGCLTRFTDDDGNPHEGNIEYLFNSGIAAGCAQNRFCVERQLLRSEAIVFLDRALSPAATATDAFGDDDGTWAEPSINRLAPLGIVRGCAAGKVCPDEPVTRGQLAALLVRAFGVPWGSGDVFRDDDGSVFEDEIEALAAIGVTRGCNEVGDAFCPDRPVRRDEAATLLARTIRWAETGVPQGPIPEPIAPPAPKLITTPVPYL